MDAGTSVASHPRLPWLSKDFRQRLVNFVHRGRPDTPRVDVEDAVQDVLLRMHELVSGSAPPAAPQDWDRYMYQAVSNRLNDIHRRMRRQQPLEADALEATPADPAHRPDAIADSVERVVLFQRLIALIRGEAPDGADGQATGRAFAAVQRELRARLNDRHWIVLHMRGLEGLGFKEIAAALGVSLGSVHGWYQTALQVCAEVLRRHDIDLEIR